MKRTLLLALLLPGALALACTPQGGGDNANSKANQVTTQNANEVTNGNVGALVRDQKKKAVQFAVHEYSGKKLAIAPDPVRLYLGDEHKLRFSAFNGLEEDIGKIDIQIVVPAGGSCPFDGGCLFTINNIDSGTESDSQTRKVIGMGTFNYKVKVYKTDDMTLILEIDPQIEIVGGHLLGDSASGRPSPSP